MKERSRLSLWWRAQACRRPARASSAALGKPVGERIGFMVQQARSLKNDMLGISLKMRNLCSK